MTTPGREDPRDVWNDNVEFEDWAPISDRTGMTDEEIYQFALEIAVGTELYNDIPEIQFDEFFQDFIQAMITGDMSRDDFFEMWDINGRDFDWADWREMMGY